MEQGEAYLRSLGVIGDLRVRHHGGKARLEVAPDQMERLRTSWDTIARVLSQSWASLQSSSTRNGYRRGGLPRHSAPVTALMRLFAAVPIPEPAREQILKLLGKLREAGWPVRWVHDEGLHMTLKFFGEVAPERLDVIAEALRFAAHGAETLALELGELGAFPSRNRPRVLWVGVQAPAALELLQDRIERGCEAIGFPPEGAPFQPHVTLGRVREGQRLPAGRIEDQADGFDRVSVRG